jgi:RimJ/RimL family protein N-acetyltransferase
MARVELQKIKIRYLPRLIILSEEKEVSTKLEGSLIFYLLTEIKNYLKLSPPKRRAIFYNGVSVGTIAFVNVKNGSAEVGYFIGKDYWNKGIATIALKKMLLFGFNKIGLKKIYAHTNKNNLNSQKVLLKNKFIMKKSGGEKLYFEKLK